MSRVQKIRISELHDRFIADGETGRIYHRIGPRAGQEAFTARDPVGYLRGRVTKDTTPSAHSVMWAMHNGYWAASQGLVIDHINGVRDDNRICNLRAVTHKENLRNRHQPSHAKSGVVGVHQIGNRWQARIRVDWKHISIGLFDTKEEAAAARAEYAASLGFNVPRQRASA
jgi:hypothetical protein